MTEEAPFLPPERPAVDLRGLRVAVLRSALAFLVLLLLAQVIVFLTAVDAPEEISTLDTVKIGGLAFFGFHHVGIGVDVPRLDLGGIPGGGGEGFPGGAFGFTASGAVAMLLATGLAVWLLYRAGRSAARAGGGTARDRLLMGTSVAVPYALLSLILSLVATFRIEVPAGADIPLPAGAGFDVGATPVAAFLWPFALAAVAGGLGGLAAARDLVGDTRRRQWALAALGGASRMAGVAAVAAAGVLVVLAAANPSVFVEYWRGVGEAGLRQGFLIVLFTALLTPNFMVVLTYLGMLSGVVAGDYVGTSSITVLTLQRFPSGGDFPGLPGGGLGAALSPTDVPLPFQVAAAPPEWWVTILIPLVAVLWGGRWAARRVALTRGEGALVGGLAGLVFAVILVVLAVLAGIGFRFEVEFLLQVNNLGRVGPSLLGGTLLAVLWGGLGGALGGMLGVRRPAPPPAPPEEGAAPAAPLPAPSD